MHSSVHGHYSKLSPSKSRHLVVKDLLKAYPKPHHITITYFNALVQATLPYSRRPCPIVWCILFLLHLQSLKFKVIPVNPNSPKGSQVSIIFVETINQIERKPSPQIPLATLLSCTAKIVQEVASQERTKLQSIALENEIVLFASFINPTPPNKNKNKIKFTKFSYPTIRHN